MEGKDSPSNKKGVSVKTVLVAVGFLIILAISIYCAVVVSQINNRTVLLQETNGLLFRQNARPPRHPLIRLVDGDGTYTGRVEVNYNGVWGTICDDLWDIEDAKVVCRMLGFSDANSAPRSATFGQGSGRIWLNRVRCIGTEASIWDCPKGSWGIASCDHDEDASVICLP